MPSSSSASCRREECRPTLRCGWGRHGTHGDPSGAFPCSQTLCGLRCATSDHHGPRRTSSTHTSCWAGAMWNFLHEFPTWKDNQSSEKKTRQKSSWPGVEYAIILRFCPDENNVVLFLSLKFSGLAHGGAGGVHSPPSPRTQTLFVYVIFGQ